MAIKGENHRGRVYGERQAKSNQAGHRTARRAPGTGLHRVRTGWNDGGMTDATSPCTSASSPAAASPRASAASPSPPRSPSTRRPRRSRRPGGRSSGSAPASPTSRRPDYIVAAAVDGVQRPRQPPLHAGRGAFPPSRRRSRPRPRATRATRSTPAQVLITNGGKQAVYEAFATLLDPGDEVILPAPYWTTYPEAIRLAGGRPGRGSCRRDPGLPRHRRPARGGAHRAHQGAAVLLAVQPDGSRLPARAGRGDRPLGRRARPLGGHRRDLRAPHLRRRRGRVDAGRRALAGRPLRRAQRRREDLRHDRLAGRLDDRARRTSSRPRPTSSRTRPPTSRTSPRGPRSRPSPATCRRSTR